MVQHESRGGVGQRGAFLSTDLDVVRRVAGSLDGPSRMEGAIEPELLLKFAWNKRLKTAVIERLSEKA